MDAVNQKIFRPAAQGNLTVKVTKSVRADRSDKQKDMKFPADADVRGWFRTQAKAKGYSSVTKFNTEFLKRALRMVQERPDWFEGIEYQYGPSPRYLTVKPTYMYHQEVFRLSTQWDCSEREALHRIMIGMMRGISRV